MRFIKLHLWKIVRSVFGVLVTVVILPVFGGYFDNLASTDGLYGHPEKSGVIMILWLAHIATLHWFQLLSLFIIGFAAGAWLDTIFGRQQKLTEVPELEVVAPAIQFSAHITAVATYDVFGQPGIVNVLPVVELRNTQQSSGTQIAGYSLKLQFPDGTENEATAQSVMDPMTFNGHGGSLTQITPDNTLWGRNGSPLISSFASGRLWFAFSNIKNFGYFASEDTKLTISVMDSNGKSNSSTVRLGDLIGPRVVNMDAATNLPA